MWRKREEEERKVIHLEGGGKKKKEEMAILLISFTFINAYSVKLCGLHLASCRLPLHGHCTGEMVVLPE